MAMLTGSTGFFVLCAAMLGLASLSLMWYAADYLSKANRLGPDRGAHCLLMLGCLLWGYAGVRGAISPARTTLGMIGTLLMLAGSVWATVRMRRRARFTRGAS